MADNNHILGPDETVKFKVTNKNTPSDGPKLQTPNENEMGSEATNAEGEKEDRFIDPKQVELKDQLPIGVVNRLNDLEPAVHAGLDGPVGVNKTLGSIFKAYYGSQNPNYPKGVKLTDGGDLIDGQFVSQDDMVADKNIGTTLGPSSPHNLGNLPDMTPIDLVAEGAGDDPATWDLFDPPTNDQLSATEKMEAQRSRNEFLGNMDPTIVEGAYTDYEQARAAQVALGTDLADIPASTHFGGRLSAILGHNRFNPGDNSPFLRAKDGAPASITYKDLQGTGGTAIKFRVPRKDSKGYNNLGDDKAYLTFEDLSTIGLSLLLNATGENSVGVKDGLRKPNAAQRDPLGGAAAGVAFLPNLLDLGARQDPRAYEAINAYMGEGGPATEAQARLHAIDTELDKLLSSNKDWNIWSALTDTQLDKDTAAYREFLGGSYGTANSPNRPFTDAIALEMVIIAFLLTLMWVIFLKLLIAASAINNLNDMGVDPSNFGPVHGIGRSAVEIRKMKGSDRPRIGEYFNRAIDPGGFMTEFFNLSKLGIMETKNDFFAAAEVGISSFFGIGMGIRDAGGAAGPAFAPVQIVGSPGFYFVYCRNVLKRAAELIGNITELVTSETSNTGAAFNVLFGMMKAIRDSGVMQNISIIAAMGDAVIEARDKNIWDEGSGKIKESLSRDIPVSPSTRVSGPSAGLAQGATAAQYLLPSSLIRAQQALGGYTPKSDARNIRKVLNVTNHPNPENTDGSKPILPKIREPNLAGAYDATQVKQIEDSLEAEYVPFYFQDLRTNEIVSFHAFLGTLNEQYQAAFSREEFFGRVDPVYSYKSTARTLNIEFYVFAANPDDFDEMWWKINKLVTLLYPQFDAGRLVESKIDDKVMKFRQPFSQIMTASPLFRLRIGDLIKSTRSRFGLSRLFGYGMSDNNTTYGKIMETKKTEIEELENSIEAKYAEATRELRKWARSGVGNMGAANPPTVVPAPVLGNASTTTPDPRSDVLKNALPVTVAPGIVRQYVIRAAKFVGKDFGAGLGAGTASDANTAKLKKFADQLKNYTEPLAGKLVSKGNPNIVKITFEKDVVKSPIVEAGVTIELPRSLVLPGTVDIDIAGIAALTEFSAQENALKAALDAAADISNNPQKLFAATTEAGASTSTANPIIRSFSEGSPGRGLAGVCTNMNFNWMDNFMWNVGDAKGIIGRRAPNACRISMDFQVVHDIVPGLDSMGVNRSPVYGVGEASMGLIGGDAHMNNGDHGEARVKAIQKWTGDQVNSTNTTKNNTTS